MLNLHNAPHCLAEDPFTAAPHRRTPAASALHGGRNYKENEKTIKQLQHDPTHKEKAETLKAKFTTKKNKPFPRKSPIDP